MKHFFRYLSLTMAILMLLGVMACTDGNSPKEPIDESSTPDAGAGDNKPEDNKPAFDVQPAENEKILQVPLTALEDNMSYLRFVYSDAQHTHLTFIYAHHYTDIGYVELGLFSSPVEKTLADEVMIVWRLSLAPMGIARPELVLMREAVWDDNGSPTTEAWCLEYVFYAQRQISDQNRVMYSDRVAGSMVKVEADPPIYRTDEIEEFLHQYNSYHYISKFDPPGKYRHDLIYSNVGGEEITMRENLEEPLEFPWTQLREIYKTFW